MKAVYVEEPFKTGMREIEKPSLKDNEVLIKVKCTGICGSDIHVYRGIHAYRKPPVILGHELSGEVVEVGSRVTKFKLGDRVTVMPQISCGECRACKAGNPNNCKSRKAPGAGGWLGTFAEYFKAPEDVVVNLPEGVDYELGALAEPVSVAVHVLRSISPENRNNLVILGSGTIGLLIMAIAKLFGFKKVLATDTLDYNLKIARELGAVKTVNVLKEDLGNAVEEVFDGEKADAVVVAAGSPNILDQAIESVKSNGEVIFLAMITKPMTFSSYPLILKEVVLKGSHTYTFKDFVYAVELLASERVNYKRFITHKFNIDHVQDAMELVDKKTEDSVKVMICI